MEKIIFATGNAGKLKEIKMILEDLPVEVVSMKEAGIDIDIEENGKTFEENAIIKAEAIRDISGCQYDIQNQQYRCPRRRYGHHKRR